MLPRGPLTRRRLLGGAEIGVVGLALGAIGASATASPHHLPRTLVIRNGGTERPSRYRFAVSGGLQRSSDLGTLDDADAVEGTVAEGSVWGDGVDGYRFAGDITEFDLVGPATVRRDGVAVDPAALGTCGADGSPGAVRRVSPGPEVTVEPGTNVRFELDLAGTGRTPYGSEWYVDGDHRETTTHAAAYEYRRDLGVDRWIHTFETPGRHRVEASVLADSAAVAGTVRWSVAVEPGGDRPPAPARLQPDPMETLHLAGDEPVTLSLTASDPDGNLDEVVWVHASDRSYLGRSPLAGSRDTATATFPRSAFLVAGPTAFVTALLVDESGGMVDLAGADRWTWHLEFPSP